jgi:putative transposase
MNALTNNKPDDSHLHHRRTLRIKGYDYLQAGAYFVTVCAYKKQALFGEIHGDKIELSDIGQLIRQYWVAIPRHFANVRRDEFVIMPNHFHGIIVIHDDALRRGKACLAPTRVTFGHPAARSLGIIIGSFKSAVTKFAHKCSEYSNIPIWQRNYYEHVIRNESDLSEKQKYIIDNPAKWNEDEYNSIDDFDISDHDFNPGRMAIRPYAGNVL